MLVEKILKWQNIIFIIIIVCFVGYCFLFGKYEPTKFANSYEYESISRVEIELPDMPTPISDIYPLELDCVQGETIRVTTAIPQNITSDFSIMTYSNYSKIEIFDKDKLIGSYGSFLPLKFGRLIGNIRVIAKIPEEYAGEQLTIDITPYYTAKLSFNSVEFGDTNALKLKVIYDNIWRLVFALILLTLSVICIGTGVSHIFQKIPSSNWAFYHMGCFLFYVQAWLVCSSDIPQLFTNANETISIVSFISLTIMPIHYAAFATEVLSDTRIYFSVIQIVGWFLPIIEIFGMFSGLYDPPEILVLNHIFIGITCLAVIFFTFLRSKNDKFAKAFGLANVLLVVFVAISLLMFYIFQSSGLDGLVLGIGLLIYSLVLFITVMKLEFDYIRELQTNQIYRELAYKDIMTDLGNRGAFSRKLELLDKQNDGKDIALVILDINKLKNVNDTMGHDKGDKLIVGAGECIKKAFGPVGECFRIGGDEFAVVLETDVTSIDKYLSDMEDYISAFNSNNPEFTLSISIGYTIGSNFGDKDFSIALYRAADERMYIDKAKWHEKLDSNG